VGLRKQTWDDHIAGRHPGVAIDWIRETVEDPDLIVWNDQNQSLNYMVGTGRHRFRLVATKERQGDPGWIVATAYPTAIPPWRQGRIVWTRR